MDTGGRDVEGRRVVYHRPNDYYPSEVPYTDLLRYLAFTLENTHTGTHTHTPSHTADHGHWRAGCGGPPGGVL